jgi:carbonic anhydrase
MDLLNNGHTLQVNHTGTRSASDPQITFAGETYWLLQFHAHSTSEHTIDGVHSPFEMHFVHQSASGGLAVVGVLMDEGAPDAALEQMFSQNPGHEAGVTCEDPIALDAEVPTGSGFYHYSGSLTTPPCSEGVEWFVLDQHGTVSAAQVEEWATEFEGTTNRPVQPLNGREVGAFGL